MVATRLPGAGTIAVVTEYVADYWFDYWRRVGGTRDERKALDSGHPAAVCAAHEHVEACIRIGGAVAIDVITVLANAASGPDQLAAVGVGPIESLLYEHGEDVVDMLVDRSRREPAVARALGYVELAEGSISAKSADKLARVGAKGR